MKYKCPCDPNIPDNELCPAQLEYRKAQSDWSDEWLINQLQASGDEYGCWTLGDRFNHRVWYELRECRCYWCRDRIKILVDLMYEAQGTKLPCH